MMSYWKNHAKINTLETPKIDAMCTKYSAITVNIEITAKLENRGIISY